MVSTKKVMWVFLLMAALLRGSLGAVHKVGDSAGWTTIGNVDYKRWASGKNFHVGDSLAFVYNNQFHNVKQVSRRDFLACNASSPIATYTSGSDSIVLKRAGRYYFLCGFPGHCQAGQKVDVLVIWSSLPRPVAAPATSPSARSSAGSAAMAPELGAQNGAKLSSTSGFLAAVYGVLVVLLSV